MNRRKDKFQGSRRWSALIHASTPYLIVTVAAALRLINLDEVTLWYDEIQSVTHANRAFPLSFISTQEYDCHPPLYSLLLSLWLLFGKSDTTILLSSVLLSCATVYFLFWMLDRLFGRKHAVLGACVLALHPFSIYWSHFARMYSLIMLLCQVCFYANHRYFEKREACGWIGFWVILSEFGIIASHIAGLFFVFFIWLFFFNKWKSDQETWRRWFVFHLKAGILYLFPLVITLERFGRESKTIPNLESVATGLSRFVVGISSQGYALVIIAALLFGFFVVTMMLASKGRNRWYGLVFMVLPFVVAIIISFLGKPIWQDERTFAFLVPFFAMGFSFSWFGQWEQRSIWFLTRTFLLAMIGLMAWGTLDFMRNFEKRETFTQVVSEIRARAQPDDLVMVASIRVGWGVKWYLIGPDWDNDLWDEYCSMSDDVCRELDFLLCLRRKINVYDIQSRGSSPRVVVSDHNNVDIGKERRIWTVTRKDHYHIALVEKHGLSKELERYEHLGIRLVLYEKE